MKKFISLLLCLFLISILFIPVFAVTTPYGSVTADTSQIKILIEAMIGSSFCNPIQHWVAYRHGEFDYRIYFNIDTKDNTSSAFRYVAHQSGYNTVWQLEFMGDQTPPVMDYNSTYSWVGDIPLSLGSSVYRDYVFKMYSLPLILMITLVLSFFVFRTHRRINI